MSTVKKFVLIALAVIVFASCNTNELEFDNIDVEDISGIFVFPLGQTSYTMRELIEDQEDAELTLQEDSTSLLTLYYTENISYAIDGEFVQIGDISQFGEVTVPASPGGADRTENINQTFSLVYQPNEGEDLDSVFYTTGDITMVTTSTLPGNMNFTYSIANTRHVTTDAPLTFSGTINGGGTDNQNTSLVDYKTVLGDNNVFSVDFSATVDLAAADALTGGETLRFDLTYANQTFSIIYGKFGQDTVQVDNQTLDISFFQDTGDEGIFFGNPQIRFNMSNTFGVPIGLQLSDMYGDDGNGGAQVFLSGAVTESPLPEMEASQTPGTAAESTIEINKGNSNIVGLLATSPSRLVFDVKGISNANDPTVSNFVRPGDQIDGMIELEVPMEIRLENLQQTFDYSLGDGLDISDLDSAFVRIVTINELPFSGVLSMEVQDADSNTLYTVADNLVFETPFINVNGFVTDPSGSSNDIAISKEGVEAFGVGARVVMTVTLNTPQTQTSRDIFVKVLADYMIEIKVGIGGLVNIGL